jgi:poly(hydroxyalkanoate) granule-associated protein
VASVTKDLADVPADVAEAAQRVWFAGLGALAMAQDEGGKLFSLLVERGREMEKAGGQSVAALRKQAAIAPADLWHRVQTLVDAQVTAALHGLDVPTKGELAALTKKIEHLTASIEKLKSRR